MSGALSSIPLLAQLSQNIDENPENLYTGNPDIQNAALQAAKFIFDLSVHSENTSKPHLEVLLGSINPSEAPQTRSQAKKRKRSPSPPPQIFFEPTPIESLFVEGMDEDQVWSQLDLRTSNICHVLDNILDKEPDDNDVEENSSGLDGEEDDYDEEMDEKLQEVIRRAEDGEDVDFDELGLDESMKELLLESIYGDSNVDSEESEEFPESEDGDEEEENVEEQVALRDPSSDEEEGESRSLMDVVAPKKKRSSRTGGHPELDDDFFDLSAFNAQTEQAEAKTATSGYLDDEDDDEEESVDLFAPIDIEEVSEDETENNPSMIYFKDFFKQPKQVKQPTTVRFRDEVRVKKIKAKGKNLPVSLMYQDDDDDEGEDEDEGSDGAWSGAEGGRDVDDSLQKTGENMSEDETGDDSDDSGGLATFQRDAISRVKEDLFAEEEDDEPLKDLTTHEKRMAALKRQITELEAENVGPKDWALMGEADSRSRPQNSLLEEDLEFDRVMKAVPVITEEIVKSLEERIKARILENRFDDVVRIRPLEDKPFLPSRFFELKDTKSTQSLAQIYEDEYVATQAGGVAGEDRDGKLKREHEEVEKLWENICNKLDALCNAHFTPKQPKATISTISNVSTASLESTLPTAKSVNAMFAPEEVFAPSSSELRSRSELTPTEKQALRRKERKAKRKTRDALNKSTDKYARVQKGGSLKKQKEDALKSVVKAGKGVTVVGKKKKDILGKDNIQKSKAS